MIAASLVPKPRSVEMGLTTWLAGVTGKEIARIAVTFPAIGTPDVSVHRVSETPALVGTAFDVAVALYYTSKALHALGTSFAAQQVRQSISLSSLLLRHDGSHDAFQSLLEKDGVCTANLYVGSKGLFVVGPTLQSAAERSDTVEFYADSILVLFSSLVHPLTPHDRQRFGTAFLAMEEFWTRIAPPDTLRAMQEAPALGLRCFEELSHTNKPVQ
jgi:hypothetical protein